LYVVQNDTNGKKIYASLSFIHEYLARVDELPIKDKFGTKNSQEGILRTLGKYFFTPSHSIVETKSDEK